MCSASWGESCVSLPTPAKRLVQSGVQVANFIAVVKGDKGQQLGYSNLISFIVILDACY